MALIGFRVQGLGVGVTKGPGATARGMEALRVANCFFS